MTFHVHPIRIYYEYTDAGGIVYHSNFLNFAERGRTELLRACGFTNSQLREDEHVIFVVRHASLDYLKPALLDDSLELRSRIQILKNSSFVMEQTLFRVTEGLNDEKLCDMSITLVCVNAQNFKPVRVPEKVRQAFEEYTVK